MQFAILQRCNNIASIFCVVDKKNNICYDQVSMYSVLKRCYTTLVNILFHISKNSGDILSGQSYCPTLYVIYIRAIRRDSRFFNSSDSNHREIKFESNRFLFNSIQSRFTEWVTESLEPGSITLTFKHNNGDPCHPMKFTRRDVIQICGTLRRLLAHDSNFRERLLPVDPIDSEQRLYFRCTYNVSNYGAYECHTMTGFSRNDNAGYVLTLLSRPFSRKTVNYCSVYSADIALCQFRGTLSV